MSNPNVSGYGGYGAPPYPYAQMPTGQLPTTVMNGSVAGGFSLTGYGYGVNPGYGTYGLNGAPAYAGYGGYPLPNATQAAYNTGYGSPQGYSINTHMPQPSHMMQPMMQVMMMMPLMFNIIDKLQPGEPGKTACSLPATVNESNKLFESFSFKRQAMFDSARNNPNSPYWIDGEGHLQYKFPANLD